MVNLPEITKDTEMRVREAEDKAEEGKEKFPIYI